MKSVWLTIGVITAVSFLCLTQAKSDEPSTSTADSMLGKALGEVRDDNRLNMKLIWCPPGNFVMEQVEQVEQPGSNDCDARQEGPTDKLVPHATEKMTPVEVWLTRGYWLGKFEVTQCEWKQVIGTEPWKDRNFTKEGDDFPATAVSWDDAMKFCRKLTEQEREAGRLPKGWKYTLPTEAEWEYACRAKTETRFNFGDDDSELAEYAWFLKSTNADESYPHQVGQKKPNQWGLCDMHGNVSEWCRDWYCVNLPGGRDPEALTAGSERVMRSGNWGIAAEFCRSARRSWAGPEARRSFMGFRVALSQSAGK